MSDLQDLLSIMGQQMRLMQHLALPMSESRGRLSQTLLAPLLRDSIPLAKMDPSHTLKISHCLYC